MLFNSPTLLSSRSNYKIGGIANHFCVAKNTEQIRKILKYWHRFSPRGKVFILGGGTNVLFRDEGFAGLVLKPAIDFIKKENNQVRVGAGVAMDTLLRFLINKKLAGLEWAGGLPGEVGGAVRGNAGAFGGEMKDSIIEVVSLDFSRLSQKGDLKIIKRNNKQCSFNYRNSIFKSGPNAGKEIILQVTFNLKPGDKNKIRQEVEGKISWRQKRQPLEYPNIGSIFKNVDWRLVPPKWQKQEKIKKHLKIDPFPILPAAFLIDSCNLKGISCGGAMISPKHPNFIVNVLGATSYDVRSLIKLVKFVVFKKYKINLEEEIIFIS